MCQNKEWNTEKKQVRKRCVTVLIAGCMAAILGGCSDKKVDYGMDTQQANKEAAGSLAQFADAGEWNDEWALEIEDGKVLNLVINAKITVPDTNTMSVVEVEELTVDADVKKRLLESFFGGTDIYYHDVEHQTKEELEEQIALLEADVENLEESVANVEELVGASSGTDIGLETMREELAEKKDLLQECRTVRETASNDYTVAAEYDSCTEFTAFLNDAQYDIRFPETGEIQVIQIRPGDLFGGASTYVPGALTELQGLDQVTCYTDTAEEGANSCSLSQEEAKKLADQFVQSNGISEYVLQETGDLIWWGWNWEESEGNDRRYVHGYSFVYGVGIDGSALLEPDYDQWMYGDSELPLFASTISLYVTEDGIIAMDWDHPLTVQNITPQVELLPLEDIQNIMENEAKEHTDQYNFNDYRYSNAMDLIYFRVRDKETEGSYSYIPAWRLSQKGEYCYHPIFINAIDGSVIYLQEEVIDEGVPTRTDTVPKG
ncbi:MAG: hypothetical protein K2O73_10675 [Lachnospiraceae bacterium]|nr:hypothetical protein [Lachnospiraceae bacterium]